MSNAKIISILDHEMNALRDSLTTGFRSAVADEFGPLRERLSQIDQRISDIDNRLKQLEEGRGSPVRP